MVKEHGLVVAAVLGLDLGVKPGRLLLGVVQLRETVAKLAPGDIELKTLGDTGLVVAFARQR